MANASTKETTFDQGNNRRSVSASDLMEIFWRQKWCLAGSVFIALGLGSVYLFHAEPTYNVTSRVLVQREGWPLDSGNLVRPDKEFVATQAEIVSSPAVIKRAVASASHPITVDPQMDPVLQVIGHLRVRPVAGTNVLNVAYQCNNSAEGISTVEAILDSYQEFLREMNDDSRLEALRLLTRSEEGLRSELQDREERFREMHKQSPLIGQGNDANIFQKTLIETLGQTLTSVKDRRIDLQNRRRLMLQSPGEEAFAQREPQELMFAAYSRPAVTAAVAETSSLHRYAALDLIADVAVDGTSDASTIYEHLYRAEARAKELAQQVGPQHPLRLAAEGEIAAWRERLAAMNRQAPAAIEREIAAVEAHENRLVELYTEELEKAKAIDDMLLKEQQELDGIERLKSIHSTVVAQLTNLRLVEPSEDGGLGLRVTILEAPTIGAGPIWPKTSVLLALCGAIGMLSGIGMVVALERDSWTDAQNGRNSNV